MTQEISRRLQTHHEGLSRSSTRNIISFDIILSISIILSITNPCITFTSLEKYVCNRLTTMEESVIFFTVIVRFLQAASSTLRIRWKGAISKFLIFYLKFLFWQSRRREGFSDSSIEESSLVIWQYTLQDREILAR